MKSKLKELQKLNNQLDKKITAENQPIFTDIICYIRSADISAYNQELVRQDLSEMIISAQDRGEDIHSVIGRDFKEFCDDIIANLSPKTVKDKFIDGLDIFCSCIAVIGTINILFSKDLYRIIGEILSKRSVNYNINVSVGMIISTFVIMAAAVIIVNTITKNALKKPVRSKKYNKVVIGFISGAGIMTLFLIIAKLGNSILFSINIFIAISLLVVFFITHKLLNQI